VLDRKKVGKKGKRELLLRIYLSLYIYFYVQTGDTYYYASSLNAGFYLGFIVWGSNPEWAKATSFLGVSGACPPRKFFEMNMR